MFLIKRIQYIKDSKVIATHYNECETSDLEELRKRLHDSFKCDKILFSYEIKNK